MPTTRCRFIGFVPFFGVIISRAASNHTVSGQEPSLSASAELLLAKQLTR